MAAPESALHGEIPPPASLVPLPFQGRQDSNTNITTTGKGSNRRWQTPGRQRGTSEFRRTVSTWLPQKVHFTGKSLHQLRWSPSLFKGGKIRIPISQLQAKATTGVGKPQADSEVRANSAGRFRHGCPRKYTSRRNPLPVRHTPRIFTRLPRQNDKKVQHPLALPAVLCYTIKAIPHKERLANLHAICLQISRHISPKCS